MQPQDTIRVFRKYWVSITVFALAGILFGVLATLVLPSKFESKTQLYVTVRTSSDQSAELVQGSNFAQQSVQSYVSIVNTDSVLEPAIEKMGDGTSVEELRSNINAAAPDDTSIIEITATADNAEQAASSANSVGESLIELVQESLGTSSDAEEVSPVVLTTVQEAVPSSEAISPRPALNIAIGLVGGIVVGIAFAVARYYFDTKIYTYADAEDASSATMLGGIMYDSNASKQPLVVHSEPNSPKAEAYRALRTNVQFLSVTNGHKSRGSSYVISSAGRGEGKSTLSVNLSIVLAETGARVLLIDGDLRIPKVAEYLGIEGGAGLTDVLIGRSEPTEVVQKWGVDQLFVIASGRKPPNPSELLGSAQMEKLIKELEQHFDYIVIDAPPLLYVTDAAVLSKMTSGTLLTVASGSTRKPELQAAIKTLETAGGVARGAVITKLPENGPDSYGVGAYSGEAYADQPETAQLVEREARRRPKSRRER